MKILIKISRIIALVILGAFAGTGPTEINFGRAIC